MVENNIASAKRPERPPRHAAKLETFCRRLRSAPKSSSPNFPKSTHILIGCTGRASTACPPFGAPLAARMFTGNGQCRIHEFPGGQHISSRQRAHDGMENLQAPTFYVRCHCHDLATCIIRKNTRDSERSWKWRQSTILHLRSLSSRVGNAIGAGLRQEIAAPLRWSLFRSYPGRSRSSGPIAL